MKLSDFMPSVCEEVNKQIEGSYLSLEFIYKVMDIDTPSNPELSNPLNKDPKVYYFRHRQTSLSGNEEIEGKYYAFDYCEHYESLRLRGMKSLQAVEEYITSPSGMPNAYTTCIVAIINGKVKPYEVTYFDKYIGKRVLLIKDKQFVSGHPFDKTYDEQVQIKWLD